jgi:hypothetical protein
MLRSRGAHGTPAELVANQVLQGLGGGLACVALQVSAQADVVHAGEYQMVGRDFCAKGLIDVATVTAMVLLITEVGNSVGSASMFAPIRLFCTADPGAAQLRPLSSQIACRSSWPNTSRQQIRHS